MLVIALGAGCSGLAGAQTVYKWTDQRGVVHFSDAPPVNVPDVEERRMTAPRSRPTGEQLEIDPNMPVTEGEAAQAGAKEESAEAKAKVVLEEGPARVILVSRQLPRIGPSAMQMTGEVKNVGGTAAHGVGVTISAVDSTQGTACLNDEAEVTPSTLQPGESGRFDVDIDSPCLYGDPNVEIAPVWD